MKNKIKIALFIVALLELAATMYINTGLGLLICFLLFLFHQEILA